MLLVPRVPQELRVALEELGALEGQAGLVELEVREVLVFQVPRVRGQRDQQDPQVRQDPLVRQVRE